MLHRFLDGADTTYAYFAYNDEGSGAYYDLEASYKAIMETDIGGFGGAHTIVPGTLVKTRMWANYTPYFNPNNATYTIPDITTLIPYSGYLDPADVPPPPALEIGRTSIAVVFGGVTPPQNEVVSLPVHLGCSKEVSSYELTLQNWDAKYSPGGTYPITVGMDGSISLGRGIPCPLVMTCHVERVKCSSKKVWRDSFRYSVFGDKIQRWLCRECGIRFSDPDDMEKSWSAHEKVVRKAGSNEIISGNGIVTLAKYASRRRKTWKQNNRQLKFCGETPQPTPKEPSLNAASGS